jgi:hypothetical protein
VLLDFQFIAAREGEAIVTSGPIGGKARISKVARIAP